MTYDIITDTDPNDKTKTKKIEIKVPARLVMTNSTISTYLNDNFTTHEHTLEISKSFFSYFPSHPDCFIIKQDRDIKIVSCALPQDPNQRDFIAKWDYDFNLFKYQCHQERDIKAGNQDKNADLLKNAIVAY